MEPAATPVRAPAGAGSLMRFSSTQDIRQVLRASLELLGERHEETRRDESAPSATSEERACAVSERDRSAPAATASPVPLERLRSRGAEIRALSRGSDSDLVPYSLLRDACSLVRAEGQTSPSPGSDAAGPWLHLLIQSSTWHLPTPPERKRSPELEARLAMLREEQDVRAYRELVKDVDGTARAGEGGTPFMATFRQQAGFGLNVVTMMFTGYLVGHAAMAALDRSNKHLHPVGGVIGLILTMLVEVVLYIVIAERAEEKQRLKEKYHQSPEPFKGLPIVHEFPATPEKQPEIVARSSSKKGPRQRRLGTNPSAS